ncbi:MAG: pilus assembly FimT family protein [Rickettsiales bacterium]
MNNKIRNGFTLLELSIVILVIAGMVVAITSSKEVLKKSRLANARSLTQQSVVNNLSDDLIAWFETSLESSFLSKEQKSDGVKITKWFDNNKNLALKNTATSPATLANQPTYISRAFYDAIPGVRFDGASYMDFDGSKLANSSYTIFVVEQRRSNKNFNFFIAGSNPTLNKNLHLGYRSNNVVTQDHYNNGININVKNYSTPTPAIHTFLFNNFIGKKYSLSSNFSTTGASNSSANLAPITSYDNSRIGIYTNATSNSYYIGDLAEIIIFKRSLKTEEVNAIKNYLGSKYGIPVS